MTKTASGGYVLTFASESKSGHVNRAGISRDRSLVSCDCDRMRFIPHGQQAGYDERTSTVILRAQDVRDGTIKGPCKHLKLLLSAVPV